MIEYTDAEWGKITGPRAEFITDEQARALLALPSGTRPRMYGLTPDGSAIVKITSLHYLDKYEPVRVWLSGTTLADLVQPAR